MIKVFGAILILSTCGFLGYLIASNHIKQIQILRELIGVVDYMECDLEYRMTPLPELCHKVSLNCKGMLSELFCTLSDELNMQVAPDVAQCMQIVVSRETNLSKIIENILIMMGELLGNFDLEGQIKGLQSVRSECRRLLDELNYNKEARIRGYQTLGLCAGAALAIILL